MDHVQYITFMESTMLLKGLTIHQAQALWDKYHPNNQ